MSAGDFVPVLAAVIGAAGGYAGARSQARGDRDKAVAAAEAGAAQARATADAEIAKAGAEVERLRMEAAERRADQRAEAYRAVLEANAHLERTYIDGAFYERAAHQARTAFAAAESAVHVHGSAAAQEAVVALRVAWAPPPGLGLAMGSASRWSSDVARARDAFLAVVQQEGR